MSDNPNARLEAFSDGVFAIALTLLIIELKAPAADGLASASDLWHALEDLLPEAFAFLLSFGIVLIGWVNHHEGMKLVSRSTGRFLYANGFMLLTMVIIPFPTALLGKHLFTEHAAPAVVLYSLMCALQGVAWFVMGRTTLAQSLARDEAAETKIRRANRDSMFAFAFYTACAIVAVWLPTAIAMVITATWIIWLVYGLKIRGA